MRTLICGSIAYDNIMVFQDRFRNHILPDQIHILNVAFLVPELRREFGGCAGNIAYTLNMLGGEPLVMATVGDDYGQYGERLTKLGIAQQHIRKVAGTWTAQVSGHLQTFVNARWSSVAVGRRTPVRVLDSSIEARSPKASANINIPAPQRGRSEM